MNSFADQLKSDITGVLNDLIPARVVTRRMSRENKHWLSEEAAKAKQKRRRLERQWKKTGLEVIRVAYRKACRTANQLINESRRSHLEQKVTEASSDPKKL